MKKWRKEGCRDYIELDNKSPEVLRLEGNSWHDVQARPNQPRPDSNLPGMGWCDAIPAPPMPKQPPP